LYFAFSSFQGCPKRNQWIRVRWEVLCVANLQNLTNLRHVSLIACFGSFLRPSVFMASCSAQGPPGSAFLSLQWSPVLSWASRLKHRTFSSPFTPPRASPPPSFWGPSAPVDYRPWAYSPATDSAVPPALWAAQTWGPICETRWPAWGPPKKYYSPTHLGSTKKILQSLKMQ